MTCTTARFSRLGAALLVASSLGACASPAMERPMAPAAIVPDGWSQNEGLEKEIEVAGYWALLEDPLIEEYVTQALARNREIATARARVSQARAALRGSRARYSPRIAAGASGEKQFGDRANSSVIGALDSNLSWELDLFGRIGFDVAASEAELRAQGASLADIQRLIMGAVVRQTIVARGLASQLEIARGTLEVQDENLRIATFRREAGLVSSRDVEQARVLRSQTAAIIPDLEGRLAATANAISVLIAQPPGEVLDQLQEAVEIPTPPNGVRFAPPATVLRNRPDVRQAEELLLADTARIGLARAELLPTGRIDGLIGATGPDIGSLFDLLTGSVIGSISQLIFDGGRAKSDVDGAEARAEASLAIWEQSILTALEDVETSSSLLRTTGRRVADLVAAREAATNAALLAREEYRAGLIDFEALLIAENQLLEIRTTLARTRADHAVAFVDLTQALGGGWSEDQLQFALNGTETTEDM
ncbi:efflux transporter outer membrane subunit [Alteriqipengyuania sp. 357]